MSCKFPFVDYPACGIAYSDKRWWFNPYATIMHCWYLILGWRSWRSLLKLTRNGLPHTVDAFQFLMLTLYITLQAVYFINPEGLRLGIWFDVLSMVARFLSFSIAGCVTTSILASVRSAATCRAGELGLPTWEKWVYFVSCAIMCIACIPSIVVFVIGRWKELPNDVLRHCELIRYIIVITVANVYLTATLICIHTLRIDRRSRLLVKTSKVSSYVGLVVFSLWAVAIYATHNYKWEGHIADNIMSIKEWDAWFPRTQVSNVLVALFITWLLPIMLCRCGLVRHVALESNEAWWMKVNETIIASAVVISLGLGIYLPAVIPVNAIRGFLTVLLFVFCFFTTAWIHTSSQAADLCGIHMYLRKHKKMVYTFKFYVKIVVGTAFDTLLFGTTPFARSSSVPWPLNLDFFDWMATVENFCTRYDARRYLVFWTMMAIYIGWLVISFGLRIFPASKTVMKVHNVVSHFLYLPCGLTATRLFLRQVECREDGHTLAWNGTPCDGLSLHRSILVLGISGSLWFVCLPSLHFAGIGKFKLQALEENPVTSVHNQCFRSLTVFVAIYLGTSSRTIVDIIIVFLATAQQVYDPLIIGHAHLNSFRAGALAAALTCNVVAPLNWVFRDSFIPFVLCLICIPTVSVVVFVTAHKRYAAIAQRIQVQITIAENADFTQRDLPPQLLAACIHAPPLTQFLRVHLGLPTEGAKRQSAVTPESPLERDDELTSLALAHLAAIISVPYGRRVLLKSREYVAIMSQWLRSPHRTAALKCVCAMADIEALHCEMRASVMPSLLAIWRSVEGTRHIGCAEIITQIRGMDEIIVCVGPIKQIRSITIPRRTVWIVPYADVFTKDDPIDALLTFPHKWVLPPGVEMPFNIPRLVIPTCVSVRTKSMIELPTVFSRLVSLLDDLQRTIRSMKLSLTALRSAVKRVASDRRRVGSQRNSALCTDGVRLPTLQLGGSTALLCSRVETRVSKLPTVTMSENGAATPESGEVSPSAVREEGQEPPANAEGEEQRPPSNAVEKGEWAPLVAVRGGEGAPLETGVGGEESPLVAVEKGQGPLTTAGKEEHWPPSTTGKEGEGASLVEDDGEQLVLAAVTQQSVAPKVRDGMRARTVAWASPRTACEDDTETTPTCQQIEAETIPRAQENKTGTSSLRVSWLKKIGRWAFSLIWPSETAVWEKKRREYVLFRVRDGFELGSEEDGVPTQRLREELTVFYAANKFSRGYVDQQHAFRGAMVKINRLLALDNP